MKALMLCVDERSETADETVTTVANESLPHNA
jgi:hypothetical protein